MSTTETPPAGPDPSQHHDEGPRVTSDEVRDLSRLRRTLRTSPENRYVAGVAGGLARHLDVDPVLIRVLFVVLTIFGGAGILLYVALWLLVPEDGRTDAPIRLDERTRALALYAAAGVSLLALLGNTVGHWGFPWPLAILALIVLAIVSQWDKLRAPRSRRTAPATSEPTPAGTATEGPVGSDWSGYSGTTPTVVTREPDPRKKGPILFWFTLALIALAEGALGVVDAAGAHIAAPAYPALAVGIIGVMLVLAAFWGRGGGLILIGLVATLVLAGSTAWHKAGVDSHAHDVTIAPTTAASVQSSYYLGTGTLTLDLSQITDPQDLAGHSIEVHGKVGQIRVHVPAGIAVTGHGHIRGVGHLQIFDDQGGGFSNRLSNDNGIAGSPLTINAELNVGDIEIDTEK